MSGTFDARAAVVAELERLEGAVMAWWGAATGSGWVIAIGPTRSTWVLWERLAGGQLVYRNEVPLTVRYERGPRV